MFETLHTMTMNLLTLAGFLGALALAMFAAFMCLAVCSAYSKTKNKR
jgi:hypothetical protein